MPGHLLAAEPGACTLGGRCSFILAASSAAKIGKRTPVEKNRRQQHRRHHTKMTELIGGRAVPQVDTLQDRPQTVHLASGVSVDRQAPRGEVGPTPLQTRDHFRPRFLHKQQSQWCLQNQDSVIHSASISKVTYRFYGKGPSNYIVSRL